MAERHPINGDQGVRYFFVGKMAITDRDLIPGMELVINSVGRGQHQYFCTDDEMVFPCNGACPKCGRSVRAERHDPRPAQDGIFTAPKATN